MVVNAFGVLSNAVNMTYNAPSGITLTPANGPTAGGNVITVSGMARSSLLLGCRSAYIMNLQAPTSAERGSRARYWSVSPRAL